MYLIFCEYDYYCQGWEEASGYFLIYADSFELACTKLCQQGSDDPSAKAFRNFKNCTIK